MKGFEAFHYLVPSTSVLACAGHVVDTVVKFSKPLSGQDISPDKQASISPEFVSYCNRHSLWDRAYREDLHLSRMNYIIGYTMRGGSLSVMKRSCLKSTWGPCWDRMVFQSLLN